MKHILKVIVVDLLLVVSLFFWVIFSIVVGAEINRELGMILAILGSGITMIVIHKNKY